MADLPPFAQATAGAFGSVVSNSLVYPLDLLSTRLQTQTRGISRSASSSDLHAQGEQAAATTLPSGSKSLQVPGASSKTQSPSLPKQRGYQSISGALREIYDKGGVKGLYKGWRSDTVSSTLSNFLFFYFRSFLIEALRQRKFAGGLLGSASAGPSSSAAKKGAAQVQLSAAEDLAAGALAGMLSRFFTTPLSNVTVRKQTSASGPAVKQKAGGASENGAGSDSSDEEEAYNDDDGPGIIDSLKEIMNERGVKGLWSGYETACLLSIVPALTFYMTNFIQRATLPAHVLNPPPATKNANGKRSEAVGPTALQTFLTSAAGNAACTLIVFPLILSKTRLQWKSPSGKRVYRSFVDVVRKTMRRSGWTGLYQGLNSQLIKGFISHGVTMMVKQRVEKIFVVLYILIRHRKAVPLSEV